MSKLELLYQPIEEKVKDAKSVDVFYEQYITTEDAEDKFTAAIRDTRFVGFKAGFATAMTLFTEATR